MFFLILISFGILHLHEVHRNYPIIVHIIDCFDLLFLEAKDLEFQHIPLDEYIDTTEFYFLMILQYNIHHGNDIHPNQHLKHLIIYNQYK